MKNLALLAGLLSLVFWTAGCGKKSSGPGDLAEAGEVAVQDDAAAADDDEPEVAGDSDADGDAAGTAESPSLEEIVQMLEGQGAEVEQVGGTVITVKVLNQAGFGDEDCEPLGRLAELRTLALSNTGIGDAGLQHLRGLKELGTLLLAQTAVTDDGLQVLRELPKLAILDVAGTRITPEGLAEFQRERPQMQIVGTPQPAATVPEDATVNAGSEAIETPAADADAVATDQSPAGNAQTFPPGTAEAAIQRVILQIVQGNLEGLDEVIGDRVDGLLDELRQGELSEQKLEELQQQLQQVRLVTARTSGRMRTVTLMNANGQMVIFSCRREADAWRITEFTIRAPIRAKRG